jgi:hypothetical protein
MSRFNARYPYPGEKSDTYVYDQMIGVEKAFVEPAEFLALVQLNVAPVKPLVGMICLADGVNWNPSSGAGVYCYHSGQWNKLG